MAAFSLYPLCI
jgi:hypothetical protein